VWVDDFEGHWPNIEDVDDGRLVEIHKKTMEAIDDPILLSQQPFTWYWRTSCGASTERCAGVVSSRDLT
jgi:hypothetical protein